MGVKDQVQVGPWGSPGGAYPYDFKPNGRITKIYIRTDGQGGCINSIKFAYIPSGSSQEYESPVYGGDGGKLSQMMYIETNEEIVALSGTYELYERWIVITSLCFKTNKKSCEFGSVSGTRFELPVKATNTKFVGFHGRYGIYLDSIGATLEPK